MKKLLCLILGGLSFGSAVAYDPLYVRTYPASGDLQLVLKDEIGSPVYSWPRTLLTYSIDFSQAKVAAKKLTLKNNETSQPEPFQLTEIKKGADGNLLFAKVSFFSDLPSGSQRTFVLGAGQPESAGTALPETTQDGMIEVDAGTLKVRLPASSSQASAGGFPSPIQGLNAGSGWCGGGRIVSPTEPVRSLDTTCTESGPLFRTYVLTYHFANGGTYVGTVRIVAGYPFVDLAETISGLTPTDGASMELNWEGFSPTKRMPENYQHWECPIDGLGIDSPVMTPGIIEEPHWYPADRVEDPSKEMIFRLAAYQGNAPRDAVPVMSFWEEGAGGRELGVFIPDGKKWNDHQYMIWQPTTLLQVRFRHTGGRLIWTYPLIEGTRETGIAFHSRDQGETAMATFRDTFEQAATEKKPSPLEAGLAEVMVPMRYALWLRSWYGGLSLDKVKDWVLTRSADDVPAAVPSVNAPSDARSKTDSATGLADLVFHSQLMMFPLGLDVGVDSINFRIVRPIVQQYLKFGSQFTPEQRSHVDALLLLASYVNSGDDLAPSRSCLSGTPNMSSDGFSVPSEFGVLFPKHPLFSEWADQFEKRIQLMGCYYTRPDVAAYDSLGGRWCESLPTYNWAYLTPTETAQTSLTLADGRNRTANAWVAKRARWLAGELSAPIYNPNPGWRQRAVGPGKKATTAPPPSPWHSGIALTSQNGFERQYPPHGAHSSGTGKPVPDQAAILGESLRRYDPLAAEYLFWAAAQRTSTEVAEGDPYWQQIGLDRIGKNNGTNPHLHSAKYTGQGIIIRAGVDTTEELSVHLDQVDQGPNYRWGDNGEGSSGVLYFYAGGQPWTGHETENTGDHTMDDASGFTTFGTTKSDKLRSIGENVLDHPLYDLGSSQFGEVTARQDLSPYSWPAYKSRSVMLVGTDYFILCDNAQGDNRFAWFTMKDLPYPKIVFLKPLGARGDHWSEVTTRISKGFLRDTSGPSIVLVSHKKDGVEMENMTSKPNPYLTDADVPQYAWARGVKIIDGVYWVKAPTSHDIVFRDVAPISYQDQDALFTGTAGVVRNRTDGSTELALFEGTQIGAQGVTLRAEPESGLGISAVFHGSGPLAGFFLAPQATKLTIEAPQTSGSTFYIDGAKHDAATQNGTLTVDLPSGRHAWELTTSLPVPVSPEIIRTEDRNAGTSVVFHPVAGADHYRLETSSDGGTSWQAAAKGTSSPIALTGLTNGQKIHVRVIAANAQKESAPGREYPVYATDQPPQSPEGLDLILQKDRIDLTWGEILGAAQYRLYRRHLGETAWTKIYTGPGRSFSDKDATGAVPPVELPGRSDNAMANPGTIYEYSVSAMNGNGEGEKSVAENSDPTGWRNWWPAGQERVFKRQTGYWLPPYVSAEAVPPLHYPQ